MAMFDNVNDTLTTVVTPVWPRAGLDAEAAWEQARQRLDQVMEALDRPLLHATQPAAGPHRPPVPAANMPAEGYAAMVAKAKEYIAAGDVFQVVLSPALVGAVRRCRRSRSTGRCGGSTQPVPVLPRFRRLPVVGLQPRDPGAAARRQGDHPPDRRHPPPRRRRRTRTSAWPPNCWPTPRNWPNT